MPGAKKCVGFSLGILSTAYGVASLRVSRTITGHKAKIVIALSQEWEESYFLSKSRTRP